MADQPKGKAALPAARVAADRTGPVVAAGVALLAVIGIGTVFSDQIAAALAPVPSASVAAPAPAQARPASDGGAV